MWSPLVPGVALASSPDLAGHFAPGTFGPGSCGTSGGSGDARHRPSAGPCRAGPLPSADQPAPERGSTSVSHASPQTSPSHAVTIRGIVRAAVERAWDRTVASGALPAMPADADRPGRRGRTPGRSGPRRLREQPGDEARPAVPDGTARHRRSARRGADRGGRRRSGQPDRRRRGRRTRLPQPAAARRRAGGDGRGDPGRPVELGPDGGRGHGPLRQRRVRLGQPDRAAPRRQRPRRVHRRPAQPRPRGGRPAGHARVLLQRLGRPDPEPRRVRRGASPGRAGPRGRLQGGLRAGPGDASSRTMSGRRRRRPARIRTACSVTGRPVASAKASRPAWRRSASGSMSGPARRGSTTRAGSPGPSSGCASAATSTSRTARSGSARPTSATTRTGSSSARTASRPTSRPTSATSPRSSAAASTT